MSQKARQSKKNPKVVNEIEQRSSGPPFTIRMGLPYMDAMWTSLTEKARKGELKADEEKFYKKWGKVLRFLACNPFYPGLKSHEITSLTQKYGKKIFESYLENNTPSAARMFWTYGPGRAEITILALEPHPDPGKYGSIKLDSEP